MASNIDPTKPESIEATTSSVRQNFSYAKDEIEALQGTTATQDSAINEIQSNISELTPKASQKRTVIYYASPISVNGTFDEEEAAQVFSRFDVIVFGDGLADTGHGDYASTLAIISRIKELHPKVEIFGYVDLGVSTNNHSIPTMEGMVDDWDTAGATGIFLDDAGYDFQTSRDRQNSMIDYVHGLGMNVFINAWNQDDLCSSDVDATYNPSGTATTLNDQDYVLLESWVINTNAYTNDYATMSDIKTRADNAVAYRESIGVRWIGTGLVEYSLTDEVRQQHLFDVNEAAAHIFGADGYGLDAYMYSASGADVAVVKPWVFSPVVNTDGVYQYDTDVVSRIDLGVTLEFDTDEFTVTRETPEWNNTRGKYEHTTWDGTNPVDRPSAAPLIIISSTDDPNDSGTLPTWMNETTDLYIYTG